MIFWLLLADGGITVMETLTRTIKLPEAHKQEKNKSRDRRFPATTPEFPLYMCLGGYPGSHLSGRGSEWMEGMVYLCTDPPIAAGSVEEAY